MGHDHHHHSPPDKSSAFAIGIVLNVGFVLAEAIYGLAAHSLALLSDAGHNLSDVFGLLIAWGAIHLSKATPTKHRTYGWRRSSILAALVNAIVLLIVVGGISWEAVQRFSRPEVVAGRTVMIVAAIGIFVNLFTALLFHSGHKDDLNVRGAYLHMAGDAAVSAAVVLAGFGMQLTGWLWLDPAMSLLVSAVILWSTWGLLCESVNLSMDAVPEGIDPHAVEDYLSTLPGVSAIHDLHIWAMSTTESALTVHLVMESPPRDDEFLRNICDELETRFEIKHATTQIDYGNCDRDCQQLEHAHEH